MGLKKIMQIAFSLSVCFTTRAQKPLVNYVNTLQGTNTSWNLSYDNTYPTIALPFQINSWLPQPGKNGDGWKYMYKAAMIKGFKEVHQCSQWMGDYGVFSLMPFQEN